MFEALRLNRLQRKVLLVILVIIVVPMLVAGLLSAAWVSRNFEKSFEGWIREAGQVDEYWLETLQRNGRLLGDALAGNGCDPAGPSLSPQLALLARELGINLIQIYARDHRLSYSSVPVQMLTSWQPGQRQAVLKVAQQGKNMLAAVAITVLPCADNSRHYLVLGTLLDRAFIDRLSQMTGLKVRLFYPEGNDYAKAFSESDEALAVRIPSAAFHQLQMKQSYYSEQAENNTYRGLYMPVVDSTGRVEAVLFSGLPHQRGVEEALTNQDTLSLVIITAGLLIGALTGFMLSRVVVRPVEYLRNGVLKVAAQDFRAEVPIKSNDELGDLARAFNAMAASLREARDEQRREFRRDKLAALGELSTSLAHEIRNPLGVINTAATLLEKAEGDPARKAELTKMIHEESARLNHLLKDFQQLARHRRPEFALIDPAQPLERALQVALVTRPDIEVERRYGHDSARVQADAELLQQAWLNLLVNALHAIGEQHGQLMLSSYVEKGLVVLALEDSGPGVPVEIVPRLFEPFFSTKKSGTGLGLTLANTLVEANGGWLELLPAKGKGARFAMRLPLAQEESA